ncbi:unnamed protein product [Litomosoides sigmodontis]|uniref:Uncharacterized protein n=1 Tax=Litomosoides sigmodontis TaxID=42156 RepID=A0A3P6TU11_LITSI|nr:unnamed protein product [Litomosoides sigmodontis]
MSGSALHQPIFEQLTGRKVVCIWLVSIPCEETSVWGALWIGGHQVVRDTHAACVLAVRLREEFLTPV